LERQAPSDLDTQLAKNKNPSKAREKNFCPERKSDRAKLLNEAKAKLTEGINSLSENHLSILLYDKQISQWGNLIGYEIPLAAESEGQLKIDLLGKGITTERYVSIVELKQADNKNDSPLMALTEAICYGLQLGRCRKKLLAELKVEDFKIIRLILAAPSEYWSHWEFKKHPDCSKKMNAIVESVSEILTRTSN